MTVHSPKTLRHIKAAWKHTKGLCQLLDSLEFMSLVTFYLENIERDQESEQQIVLHEQKPPFPTISISYIMFSARFQVQVKQSSSGPEQNILPVTKSFMALYPYRCPSFK